MRKSSLSVHFYLQKQILSFKVIIGEKTFIILTVEKYVTILFPASALRPADPPPLSSQLDVNVPCNDGSYQRDERDCSKYMMCVHGKWQEFQCANILEWDAVSVVP